MHQRTLKYLKEIENPGDTNSVSRVDLIKRKYYLNDDFSRQQFLLDWTLVQMSGPFALAYRLPLPICDQELEEKPRVQPMEI